MKVTICASTNTVQHITLLLSIQKYGRNSSEFAKLTAYPLTPVMRDSESCNFAFTKEKKQTYTGLHRPWGFKMFDARRISRIPAYEGGKLVSFKQRPPLPTRIYCCHPFLLEADTTPRLWCSRKQLVIQNPICHIGNRTRYLPACGAVSQPTQSQLYGSLGLSIVTRKVTFI